MMAAFEAALASEEMDRIKINNRGEKRAYAKMYICTDAGMQKKWETKQNKTKNF